MSSTNVHSDKQNNIYCAGAQIIPTEKEVEIPPKSAKKGPNTIDIILDQGIEIVAEYSELHKDGKLVAKDGTQVAKFDKLAFNEINRQREIRSKRKVKSVREAADR